MSIERLPWFGTGIQRWMERRRREATLRKQGFLVFCAHCGTWLNEHGGAEPTAVDGVYNWTCSECGKSTKFDITPPVPLRVDA